MLKTKLHMWKGVKITDSAINQILLLMKKNKKILGIRISIKKSGCAGFKYCMNLVFKKEINDFIFKYKDINIYVVKSIIKIIDETIIDYVSGIFENSFVFRNPKIDNLCGCGKSFKI